MRDIMKWISKSLILLTFTIPSIHALEIEKINLYGKIALLSSVDLDHGSQALGDNSSRIGIKYTQKEIIPNWNASLRGEWSVSTNRNNSGFGSSNFRGKQYDVVSNDGPFGNRLGYLQLSNGNFEISAGKMWSVFYDIPEYTDILATDGARASSVYTRTGEVDGTYRASEIIQVRYRFKDFRFGLQTKLTGKEAIQYDFDEDGTAESTLVYKQVQAGSIQYIGKWITLGVSAINLTFDNNGNDESQLSVSYGFKTKYKDVFLNGVYTRAKDLELTDDNRFVHSDGIEAILGYNLTLSSKVMTGINRQSRSESGDFKLLYYYASYMIDIKSLNLAAEYIHGDSTNSDGSDFKDHKLKLSAALSF
ncbi:putative exported protein [Halobacteriovorax marinus SJ]|uniref:Exported protein n=2 Tax=Halobacteriovorax marinus TaxID=97084 RepID=E1WYI8_HALMS|nr:putative exported protein [Halobacteriovorax marinus SJ]